MTEKRAAALDVLHRSAVGRKLPKETRENMSIAQLERAKTHPGANARENSFPRVAREFIQIPQWYKTPP